MKCSHCGVDQKQILDMQKDITDLVDRLNNGIRYDKYNNLYILVWTKMEIEEAKKSADELIKYFRKNSLDNI